VEKIRLEDALMVVQNEHIWEMMRPVHLCCHWSLLSSTLQLMRQKNEMYSQFSWSFPTEGIMHVKLEVVMVHMLKKVHLGKYDDQIRWYHGKPVLYVQLKKALYGTLQAALQFWKKLSSTLQGWVFIINPYDQFVANKDVNGSQCTFIWYVDDLKISHKSTTIVTEIIKQLQSEFGRYADLSVTHRRIHEHLVMTLDFNQKGEFALGWRNI